jgi:putative intracellular protease/amidase
MPKFTDKKILILVEAMYEDLELWYTKIRLLEEGAQAIVAGPEKKTYLEQSVVVAGHLISSRTPPDFCRALIRALE